MMKRIFTISLIALLLVTSCYPASEATVIERTSVNEDLLTYRIVDTNQRGFYGNTGVIDEPTSVEFFYGQDANYITNVASYTNNGDGTITDQVTGLMWQQDPGEKVTFTEGALIAESSTLGGYNDWRVPTIKELYSLIDFNGVTGMSESSHTSYLDDDYFIPRFGDTSKGERFIDGQYMTQTVYVSTTMNGDKTMFGVNFVDGRIKGYPMLDPRTKQEKGFYLLLVRGNEEYGKNNYIDNGDGTITDLATGLMWMQNDSGQAMSWQDALEHAEETVFAGYEDWKLPDAKELQSIVDYSKSPKTSNSAAIDDVFNSSIIVDEGGNDNYPFYWSSTTHLDGPSMGASAVYVAFGEALGFMEIPPGNNKTLMDVHGAGAQRSDPKTGSSTDYPEGFGPQGDVRRINNYVRLVRTVEVDEVASAKVSYDFSGTGVMVLGSGGPSLIDERSGPSVLFYSDGDYFLVDMGAGTQDQLMEVGVDVGDIKNLMFTHHHLDHNEEFIPIFINGWLRGRNKLNLFGTSGTNELHAFVSDFYKEDMEYRASSKMSWNWNGASSNVFVYEDDASVSVKGVDISSMQVNHSIDTKAYRFDTDFGSVVVTGDLRYTDGLGAFASACDVLIIDSGSLTPSSSLSNKGASHGNLLDISLMALEASPKILVLTHLGGSYDEEEVKHFIKDYYKGTVVFAEDLMNFTIK